MTPYGMVVTKRAAPPPGATSGGMPRAMILLLAAIAARAVTFGNPILHVDEEFYFTVARAMTRGSVLYVDIWDRKPIGLFLLYVPAALFDPPIGIWVYQAMALAAVVATAAIVARLADHMGWARGATAAGILYILLLELVDGQGGQAPIFYNLPMAAAVLAILMSSGRESRARRRLGVVAMGLVGVALQIKYSVVFEGMALGIWLLREEYRTRRFTLGGLAYSAVLACAALIPTASAFAAYASLGAVQPFLYDNFLSIFARHGDPVAASLHNLEVAAVVLAPLVILAAIGATGSTATPTIRTGRQLLWWWLAAAMLGFLVFGSWFNHYLLPVMVPVACCAAGAFARAGLGRWLPFPVLATTAIAGQIILQSERHARGTPAEFEALVAAIGVAPGSLYVASGSAMLYSFTARRPLSRYVLPSHLTIMREQGAIGVDQAEEVDRIVRRRPDRIVTRPIDEEERPEIRARIMRSLVQGGYVVRARRILGRDMYTIYARPASAIPSAGDCAIVGACVTTTGK